jgi:hypothetical protein
MHADDPLRKYRSKLVPFLMLAGITFILKYMTFLKIKYMTFKIH